jgi:hypothetical protein
MGLRGKFANPVSSDRQPVDDPMPEGITAEAIRIYKKMRAIEHRCDCPQDAERCTCHYGKEFWDLNAALNKEVGTLSFPVYENPQWGNTKFQQSAVDRFHLLEAAASKAKKKRTFEYKWER